MLLGFTCAVASICVDPHLRSNARKCSDYLKFNICSVNQFNFYSVLLRFTVLNYLSCCCITEYYEICKRSTYCFLCITYCFLISKLDRLFLLFLTVYLAPFYVKSTASVLRFGIQVKICHLTCSFWILIISTWYLSQMARWLTVADSTWTDKTSSTEYKRYIYLYISHVIRCWKYVKEWINELNSIQYRYRSVKC